MLYSFQFTNVSWVFVSRIGGSKRERVDWEEVDGLWRDLKCDTFITLETNGVKVTADSVRYLKNRGLFGLGGTIDHE